MQFFNLLIRVSNEKKPKNQIKKHYDSKNHLNIT
jgi:hypothetical protein